MNTIQSLIDEHRAQEQRQQELERQHQQTQADEATRQQNETHAAEAVARQHELEGELMAQASNEARAESERTDAREYAQAARERRELDQYRARVQAKAAALSQVRTMAQDAPRNLDTRPWTQPAFLAVEAARAAHEHEQEQSQKGPRFTHEFPRTDPREISKDKLEKPNPELVRGQGGTTLDVTGLGYAAGGHRDHGKHDSNLDVTREEKDEFTPSEQDKFKEFSVVEQEKTIKDVEDEGKFVVMLAGMKKMHEEIKSELLEKHRYMSPGARAACLLETRHRKTIMPEGATYIFNRGADIEWAIQKIEKERFLENVSNKLSTIDEKGQEVRVSSLSPEQEKAEDVLKDLTAKSLSTMLIQ